MRLQDKVVLLTGAAGNIGAATARKCVAQGAKVMLADLTEEMLQPLVAELGADQSACVAVDVTNEKQAADMVRACVEKFGGIDVFYANAGIEGKLGEIVDGDVGNLDKVLAVNVRGVWLGLHYVIPVMRDAGGGSIVITASGAGVKGSAGTAPYNTSKHAVIGLMRCAALECAKHKIRVNCVAPGPIDSRMMSSIAKGVDPEGNGAMFDEMITAATPLSRYGQPEEVADMMLFLGTDESSYCTGSVYMVDGGNATG